MKLAGLILAGAAGVGLAIWEAYRRGKLTGRLIGFEAGSRHGFARGLARGTVITCSTFAGLGLQRPILEDLTLGGRLEERMREAAARKPS